MPFQPGQSGNPKGRPPKNPFADMLRVAITDADGDKTQLRHIADALVIKAKSGDVPAIKEVADRLDGKVPQGVALSGTGENGEIEVVTKVERIIRHVGQNASDNNSSGS